jgi:alanyl-tRNA synthetase
MKASALRRSYIDFFVKKAAHAEIAGASLLPENDPTVLFTTAGMQPLVPFLMGEPHPAGTRLVNVQKCMRTDDIEEVGDNTHFTFFEMLGNWSLGDYFKKEAILWSFQFLTLAKSEGGLELDLDRICVTCFAGDSDAPKDEEAAGYWEELGFVRNDDAQKTDRNRIYFFPKKDNWWGPAGQTGPCGPDTEIFYYVGDKNDPKFLNNEYAPNDEANLYVEIWNNVFMEFNKQADGSYKKLEQQCVDTGMGLERVTTILQGKNTPFETELFTEVMTKIKELAANYQETEARIVADHIRSAVFVLGDPRGVTPGNTDQSYILRRLIRRAIRSGRKMGIDQAFTAEIGALIVHLYGEPYTELLQNRELILNELKLEEEQFSQTLVKGEKEFRRIYEQLDGATTLPGELAFKLYDTYGFPIEMTKEVAAEHGLIVDEKGFDEAFLAHQELSRKGAEQKFKGGLADNSEATTKLHTATHLLHKALRMVLGDHVEQKGSNITHERLRFDFNHNDAMTPEQIEKVEKIVNEQIQRDLPINFEEMSVDEAKKQGAIGLFEDKYAQIGNNIKVYRMGDFSLEICGGPHANSTSELKSFKIQKEQSSSRGVRRIKAVIG